MFKKLIKKDAQTPRASVVNSAESFASNSDDENKGFFNLTEEKVMSSLSKTVIDVSSMTLNDSIISIVTTPARNPNVPFHQMTGKMLSDHVKNQLVYCYGTANFINTKLKRANAYLKHFLSCEDVLRIYCEESIGTKLEFVEFLQNFVMIQKQQPLIDKYNFGALEVNDKLIQIGDFRYLNEKAEQLIAIVDPGAHIDVKKNIYFEGKFAVSTQYVLFVFVDDFFNQKKIAAAPMNFLTALTYKRPSLFMPQGFFNKTSMSTDEIKDAMQSTQRLYRFV